jgi:ADP-heptose:LPS heptosyltransferase
MLKRYVLMLHQGALGDFIVTWPMLMGLSRAFAQCRVVAVTHTQKGKLAERVLGVESADIEAGWHALFAGQSPADERTKKFLGGARAIYSFIDTPSFVGALKSHAPDAEIIPLSPRPSESTGVHTAEYIVGQLRTRPLDHTFAEAMLRSVRERGLMSNRAIDPTGPVVIHPGSGSPTKNWPIDRFAVVGERLRAVGRRVQVVLGEAERDRMSDSELRIAASVGETLRPATLIELLDAILGASTYIGNDSGPSHLAGIVGAPSVVLFGKDPTGWAPLGPRVSIVSAASMDAIDPQTVTARALERLVG